MELSSISIAITSLVGALFSPGAMFTAGVNGAWYDPSDFSTMFQDAAGTTPVTAVGQPVGRILDKSGRGNHAFNGSSNSANFPVLSARYNLLTYSNTFSNAVWTASSMVPTSSAVISPDGTADAWTLTGTSTGSYLFQSQPTTAGTFTASVYLRAGAVTTAVLQISSAGNGYNCTYNLSTGVAGAPAIVGTGGTLSAVSATMTPVGDGWHRCTFTFTTSGTANNFFIFGGNGTIIAFGADLRVTNDALNQPAYQRVNTATDYDTVGFKPYLSFNGVNQWLQTNNIDFTYGDKMFISAGVRKLSDAALGTVVGLTTGIASNNGAFRLAAPGSAAPNLAWSAKGTTQVDLTSATYTAPITSIISGTADIAGSSAVQRINGAQTASSASSLGAGNFSNAALYLGATGGASNWLNGRLYGLVVAGKAASASEIASTEAWLNQKTGAY